MIHTEPLYLGPFELGKPLKSGGMATIYHGSHRHSGQQVAVKIISPDQLGKPSLRRAIRKEVNTIADLNHPNIVKIFDLGEIDKEQAQRAPDILLEGAPWYAMELVNGGALLDAPPCKNWTEARRLMLELLDALAHAHAAGVIHRDLKPGNVLLATSPDEPSHIKLVDFGIAQIITELGEDLGDLTSEHHVTGTPRYMAPEQVSGRHREHGPWTDLYAFGCLAWYILTGFPPFSGNMIQVMQSHLKEMPPALVAQFPIPKGVEQWVLKLLAKQPYQRYRHAADAAHGLIQLPAHPPQSYIADNDPTSQIRRSDIGKRLKKNEPNPTLPTLSFLKKASYSDPDEDDLQIDGPETIISEHGDTSSIPDTLQIPITWRRPEATALSNTEASSMGLFKLRMPPLIGRIEERNYLWDTMRQVVRTHSCQAVIIQGAEGVGKTRLAQWFTRRSEEVGACTTLFAHHDEHGSDFDGARQMFTNHFRCSNLEADALMRHLQRVWIEDPIIDLSRESLKFLAPWLDAFPIQNQETLQDSASVPFHNPRYRYPHIFKLLEQMSKERPLILWFEDAHHSIESIHFVLALLDYANTHNSICAMILLNVQEDATHKSVTAPLLKRLLDPSEPHNHPKQKTSTIQLQSLSAREHRELIQTILPLDPTLAEEVAQRTEGHPGFAFALLSDWIDNDQLQPTLQGLTLKQDNEPLLPETMRELWLKRLNQTLANFPAIDQDETLIALEMGSVLGRTIYNQEWHYCCSLLQISVSEKIISKLLDSKLITSTPQGWQFAHPILREVLQKMAEQRGALSQYHHHCVTMLTQLYEEQTTSLQLRLAHHCAHAGQLEQAITYLQQSSDALYLSGEYSRALDALGKRIELLELVTTTPSEPRVQEALLIKLQLLIDLQQLDHARELFNQFNALNPDILTQPRTSISSLHEYIQLKLRMTEGRIKKTIQARDSVLHACQNHPDDPFLTSSLLLVARAHILHGQIPLAEHLLTIAQQRYTHSKDKHGYALSTYSLAECALIQGRYPQAERLLLRARALFHDNNIRSGELLCAHRELDLLRLKGKLDDANLLATQLDQHFAQLAPTLRVKHLLHKFVIALEDGLTHTATELQQKIDPLKTALEFSDAITYQVAAALHLTMQNKPQLANQQLKIAQMGLQQSGLCTIQIATLLEILGHATRDSNTTMANKATATAQSFLTQLGATSRLTHAPAATSRPSHKKP